MRRTYLDTGVLIEAASGKGAKAELALTLLGDVNRSFLSCPYLDLELLPQVILNRNRPQQRFLEAYLAGTERIDDLNAIFRVALAEACRSAVSGMDALHVAAAHLLEADEFITTEKPGKLSTRTSWYRSSISKAEIDVADICLARILQDLPGHQGKSRIRPPGCRRPQAPGGQVTAIPSALD